MRNHTDCFMRRIRYLPKADALLGHAGGSVPVHPMAEPPESDGRATQGMATMFRGGRLSGARERL